MARIANGGGRDLRGSSGVGAHGMVLLLTPHFRLAGDGEKVFQVPIAATNQSQLLPVTDVVSTGYVVSELLNSTGTVY